MPRRGKEVTYFRYFCAPSRLTVSRTGVCLQRAKAALSASTLAVWMPSAAMMTSPVFSPASAAGQKAADKAFGVLGEVGLEARILKVTSAKDPDEYIKKFCKLN